MKKRISLLACVLAATFSIAGCSGEEQTVKYDETTMEQVTETMLTSFSQMGEQTLGQLKEYSDYELEFAMMQTGLPMEGKDFISIMETWEAAEDECGDYVKHGDYEVEASKDEIKVTTLAEYEERDATMTFKYDDKMNLKSLDVSAKYSTGEILKKAGLNTLLGMGTVFVVLLFLSFVISLFKYIPNGEKKAKEEVKEPAQEPVILPAEEDVTDDLELVAVISAAIAASEGTSADGFVVRSIKRRKSNNWN